MTAGWRAHLALHYTRDGERTIALDRHEGPLRVLQRLYPEGPGICHHVIVHPPGGIVGGDELHVDVRVDAGAHALLTTPGATRFYRSAGARALQQVRLQVGADARLEWLPLETLVYDGALARNRQCFVLGDGAEMIGWDLLALGLPAAGEDFDRGSFAQHLEMPGVWLEHGTIHGSGITNEPRDGATHMFCARATSELATRTRALGFEPSATATLLATPTIADELRTTDFVLTSAI